MKKIILAIIFLIFPLSVQAEPVVINEFLIDPQQQVEVLNTSNVAVDISNWYIDDNGGTTFFTIPSNTILYPNSCLVFSDNFNLNKTTTDTVRLFDSTATPTNTNAHLVDSFTYDKSQGINMSFARKPDGTGTFTAGMSSLGNFNATNASCIILPSPSPTSSPTPTFTVTPTPTFTPTPTPTITSLPTPTESIKNIYITEAMVQPNDGEVEWVELYNDNDFSITLQNWYLDDTEDSGSTPKLFTLSLGAKSYGVVDLTSSMLNNDEDTVRLLDTNKVERFSFEYSSSVKGQTYGSTQFGNRDSFCLQIPSKATVNNDCITASATPIPTVSNTVLSTTPKPTNSTTPSPIIDNATPAVLGVTTKKVFPTFPIPQQSTKTTLFSTKKGKSVEYVEGTDKSTHTKAVVKSLSFSSLGFSLISIISIIFKIKNMA